jgi:hypothetical protein
MPIQNQTGLSPSNYTVYVVGWSQKGGPSNTPAMELQSNGTWASFSSTSGTIPAYRVGTGTGEVSSITLDPTVPVNSGTLTFAYVPTSTTFNGFSFTTNPDGTLNVIQLPNPPFNSFPYSLVEVTQPLNGSPTVDASAVLGFLAPITATLDGNFGQPGQQVGQPSPSGGVTRGAILSAYDTATAGTPYHDLLFGANSIGGQQAGGIQNPQLYLANGMNSSSPLNTVWNTTLSTLFNTSGRTVTMIGSDGQFYVGTPTTVMLGGNTYNVLDFVGYTDSSQTTKNGNEFHIFSPLTPDPAGTYQANESAGEMVFAGDGVFHDTSANVLIQQGGPDPSGVVLNLELNLNEALNRGVALLTPSGPSKTNSDVWGTETNWYAANQTENVYSAFVHSAAINGKTIAALPLGSVQDAQGATMGTAYGFPDDETPTTPSGQPQVPAKFDPVPSGVSTVTLTLDPWGLGLTLPGPPTPPPARPEALQGFLFQGPESPRNTALDVIITDPTPRAHTLYVFWGDSGQPQVIPLGVGAGTFFFQATHRYSKKSFRQHRHQPYTVTAFALSGSGASRTLLAGGVLVFQYFPQEVASFVNG